MKKMNRFTRPFDYIWITLGLFATLCFITGVILFVANWLLPDPENWRSTTSPLSEEVLKDLCEKFSGQESTRLCTSREPIFAPHFFPIISDEFQVGRATYDEVQAKLGEYQKWKGPVITLGSGEKYFEAWYDLKGDSRTAIIFYFSENGEVIRIINYLGDED